MKLKIVTIICIAIYCWPVFSQSVVTTENPGQWMEQRFAKGVVPPFSFVYGKKKSSDFIRSWQYKAEKVESFVANEEKFVYTYTDPSTGLVVKCTVTCFTDFPAVEWVLHFSNPSGKNTPLIEKVAVVDYSFISNDNGTFILHHARGSNAQRTDFQPLDETMQVGKNIYMTPSAGRSSDGAALPFFNIEMPGGQGMMVAVGWTGKWYADAVQSDAKTVALKAGMEKMQLALYPKEEIRTPSICLLFWKGEDRMTGHNQFRQFILAHHSPKINGRFAEPPLSAGVKLGDSQPCYEYECVTADYIITLVKTYQQYNIVPDVFWLDAGWYEGCGWDKENGLWWFNVGNWFPAKERFPDGLRPVADAVHKAGAKFLVWFEPERVRPNTLIDREHAEWLIKLPGRDDYLFDLGNKDACRWLTDYITDFIKKEGIDYYRQDFNFDPYPYWTANDKSGRTGMSEIRHIEGLYAFWDSLLVRFPNLLIDNCSSGGRRLDLETTSRSVPLWRTDYQYFEPNGQQCHTYSLNFYLPIHTTGLSINSDYIFRSGLGAGATAGWTTGRGMETMEMSRKYMQEFRALRPYFYGDYYPLTSTRNYTSDAAWLAYQLNRPQEKDGIIIAFRRIDNKEASLQIKPCGLEKEATYELFYEDYGIHIRQKGSELMNGFDITIPTPSASLLIKYKQVN